MCVQALVSDHSGSSACNVSMAHMNLALEDPWRNMVADTARDWYDVSSAEITAAMSDQEVNAVSSDLDRMHRMVPRPNHAAITSDREL